MKKIPQKPAYYSAGKLEIEDALYTPQSGVRLTGGLFRERFEENREFLRTLDMGSIMYHFDVKTGTPTEAEPYHGHFEDNLKGQTLSMFMMGAGNILRWTDDADLSERLAVLTKRLYTSAEEDGFLMPIDKRRFAVKEYPHYVRIWLSYGLGAVGLSYDETAYEYLRRWQDWFDACIDLPIIKYLELAFQGVVASTYVYLTPAGERRDVDVTIESYEEPWRLAQFMRREKDAVHIRTQPGVEPHAHGSELEAYEGYLDLYRATGRNYYLDAVLGIYELYKRDWQHIGGGIVMCEGMGGENYPKCYWLDTKRMYNEVCCSSFWLHICQRLLRLFPEKEEYAGEIEKSLYNVMFANQAGNEGFRTYAYMEGKKRKPHPISCCMGVGTMTIGALPEFVFSLGEKTVAVNLYVPAEIDLEEAEFGGRVTLVLDADAPAKKEVRLTVKASSPVGLTLSLRIPAWSAGESEVRVNGVRTAVGKPGSYLKLTRVWADGDTVEFELHPQFRLTKYVGAGEIPDMTRYGVEYGPVLYAVAGPSFRRARLVGWSVDDFRDWLVQTEAQRLADPLVYDIAMKPGYRFVPYYSIGSDDEFSCLPVFGD